MELYAKLEKIQKTLKAPKNQMNKFGGYRYRSCEDILEAVKPLLDGAVVLISDSIKEIGDRIYVEAAVTFTDGKTNIVVTASARESLDRKGMDDSQITGSTSSYARKYALNGLFLIDDTKDADAGEPEPKKKEPVPLDLDKVFQAMMKAPDLVTLTKFHDSALKRATPEQAEQITTTFNQIKGNHNE